MVKENSYILFPEDSFELRKSFALNLVFTAAFSCFFFSIELIGLFGLFGRSELITALNRILLGDVLTCFI